MKKIPTLFKREFQDHRVISISPELSSPDLAWVLAGEGTATEKIDGACCAIINGRFYKRYDAKKNKKRSTTSTVMFILLYMVVMVGILGGNVYLFIGDALWAFCHAAYELAVLFDDESDRDCTRCVRQCV